jgi:isopentenyl phosphate kinase
LRLAVYAKRYISGLWEDIKKDPYTAIFNEKVSGRLLWALVRLEREIEHQLLNAANVKWGREKLVLVHGNRFVAHIVLNKMDLSKIGNKGAKIKSKLDEARKLTSDIAGALLHILTTDYLESYPGNLFKNQDKQEELEVKLIKLLDEGFQPPQLIFTFD